uniref:heat shock 22 kDa protein, mitochondrial-like n=1 Tax=Erigeron canadensis TaxID=72917 RepID=UPI001CB89A2B|nr:heat shock 22 kDa protein, mitochondrial-like [Erigeron canadensis]
MSSSKLLASKMLLTRCAMAHHHPRPTITATGVAAANRFFNTHAVQDEKIDGGGTNNNKSSSFFYDGLINRFSTTRRLSRFYKRRFEPVPSSVMVRPRCYETNESLQVFIDVPGMAVENMKISVENNNAVLIVGEGDDHFEAIHKFRKYICYIDLPDVDSPDKTYSTRGIKAEMKFNSGQVALTIPKLKPDEIAFNVNINPIIM